MRFTEQTEVKAVGDGWWKAASEAPTSFKVYVPDPVAGQIGGTVMMKDAGKPIQVAVRLKVQDRQVVEAEHLIWSNVNANSLANLQTSRPACSQRCRSGPHVREGDRNGQHDRRAARHGRHARDA